MFYYGITELIITESVLELFKKDVKNGRMRNRDFLLLYKKAIKWSEVMEFGVITNLVNIYDNAISNGLNYEMAHSLDMLLHTNSYIETRLFLDKK